MQLPAPSPDGDFVSALFTRGACGGSPGLTCSLPGQRRRAQPEPGIQLPWQGKVPGTCFSGTSHLLPYGLRLGWERRGGEQGWSGRQLRGPGGVVPAEEPRKLQRAFRRGSKVSRRDCAPQHQPGTRSAHAGLRRRVAASPGALLARPRGGSGCRLRLPLASFHPNLSLPPRPGTPSRGPGRALGAGRPVEVDAISAAPEREGCAGAVTVCLSVCLPGFQPPRPAPRTRLVVLRAGVPQPVPWGSTACAVVPPACSVPDRSLSTLC